MTEFLDIERAPRQTLIAHQSTRLAALIHGLPERNQFYTKKLKAAALDTQQLHFPQDLSALPFTTKAELATDQTTTPPWGTALSEPIAHYVRYNQTSSTTGNPLRWIDTAESWQWMLDCWKAVYRAARVSDKDRIFFPFSFGPFLGFWTGFDAATQIGAHAIPSGGMTSHSRLTLIDTTQPTVVCCTPTYALRLLDVSQEVGLSLRNSTVETIIVAGEPGGSIPATRTRIEDGWGARVIDHYGLTEVGPIGFECWDSPGCVHINEQEFIAEILDPETREPVEDGQQGELVITNLGRAGSPIIRYRTRDLVVRTLAPCTCGRTFARLVGGITARADDMVNVRGVNVYPSAIEAIIRKIPEVLEYRCTVTGESSNRSISIEVEPTTPDNADFVVKHVTNQIRQALGLSVVVRSVKTGGLPRFEMKARRFLVER